MTATAMRLFYLVGEFWNWWTAELLGMLPVKLFGLLSETERLVLQVLDGAILLSLEGSRGPRSLGTVALADLATAQAKIQTLIERRGLTRRLSSGRLEVRLRLSSECALRTTVELPAAAADNLSEVVTFELDRHTPFRASQAFVGCRLLKLDRTTGILSAAITVVPRQVVEEGLTLATKLGLQTDEVDVAAADPSNQSSTTLFLQDVVPSQPKHSSALSWALAMMVAILTAVAISLPLVAAQHEAAELTARFAVLKEQATARAAAQRTLDALHTDQNFLIVKKRASPTISQLLLEATRLLPDDTSLTEFHVTGPEVQMAGMASSASSLIALLEESRVFRDTNFRSPVTQDARSGRERFLIGARVVPGSGR